MVGNELLIFGFPITSCLKDDKWRISIYINLLDSQLEGAKRLWYTQNIQRYCLCKRISTWRLWEYGLGSFFLASFKIACRKGLLPTPFPFWFTAPSKNICQSWGVSSSSSPTANRIASPAKFVPLLKNQAHSQARDGMIRRWSAIACPLPFSFRASGWRTQYRTLRVTSATLLYGPWGLAFQRDTSAGPSLQHGRIVQHVVA